jgi:hypothetical protein
MAKITFPYFSLRYDVDFLLTKQNVLHVSFWRIAFYTHISTSLLVLLLGTFQFSKSLLKRSPGFHRAMGKGYIVLILFFSAPSGLVMAFYANGGVWTKTSFVVLSLLWWCFTLRAYYHIRKQRVSDHISDMIRSYALTLSAITLRTFVVILPIFIHLHGKEMYILVSWLSWTPNLLIAEFIIRKKWIALK